MYTRLKDYVKNTMTVEECQQAEKLFGDNIELISFVVKAYNRYVKSQKERSTYLIVNPEALFVDDNQENKFIMELKQYVRHVIIAKQREDIENANSISQRTDNPTA